MRHPGHVTNMTPGGKYLARNRRKKMRRRGNAGLGPPISIETKGKVEPAPAAGAATEAPPTGAALALAVGIIIAIGLLVSR